MAGAYNSLGFVSLLLMQDLDLATVFARADYGHTVAWLNACICMSAYLLFLACNVNWVLQQATSKVQLPC